MFKKEGAITGSKVEEYRVGNKTIIKISTRTSSGRWTSHLELNGEIITPEVSNIKLDMKNGIFLITDRILIDENYTSAIYFYVNTFGKPIGLGFSDLDDYYFSIPEYRTTEEFILNYNSFKFDFLNKYRLSRFQKHSKKEENAKRLALVSLKNEGVE